MSGSGSNRSQWRCQEVDGHLWCSSAGAVGVFSGMQSLGLAAYHAGRHGFPSHHAAHDRGLFLRETPTEPLTCPSIMPPTSTEDPRGRMGQMNMARYEGWMVEDWSQSHSCLILISARLMPGRGSSQHGRAYRGHGCPCPCFCFCPCSCRSRRCPRPLCLPRGTRHVMIVTGTATLTATPRVQGSFPHVPPNSTELN